MNLQPPEYKTGALPVVLPRQMPRPSYRFSWGWHLFYIGVNNAVPVKWIQSPVYLGDTPPSIALLTSLGGCSRCCLGIFRRGLTTGGCTLHLTALTASSFLTSGISTTVVAVNPLRSAFAAPVSTEEWNETAMRNKRGKNRIGSSSEGVRHVCPFAASFHHPKDGGYVSSSACAHYALALCCTNCQGSKVA